jgi:hypothetical protein
MKKVILLSGTKEHRAGLLEILTSKLNPEVNRIAADILSIEDFERFDMKGAYADLKKRFKTAIQSSRLWIVVNVPADTRNAWQSYVDLCLKETMEGFEFFGFAHDGDHRKLCTGRFAYHAYLNVDKEKCTEIMNSLVF